MNPPGIQEHAPAPAGEPPRKVYRIGELTRRIKGLLEDAIGRVWVEGEVSNFTRSSAGHCYFTLKDADAQIAAVWFKGAQGAEPVRVRDGDQVRAEGDVTVYEVRGNYQLLIRRLEPAGRGSLLEQFEALKKKLAAEGLFDAARKRPLPLLPLHVGVVTSPTGAAVRDILQVLNRRFPNLHVVIAPVKVQGDRAAEMIAAAIGYFSGQGQMDVLIVGRGGGSLEDLWAFNEEVVARAVAACTIPVISAVGHETDFTICDFVADARAPTPSAAAELVVGRKDEFIQLLAHRHRQLRRAAEARILACRHRLTRAGGSYVFREPAHLLRHHRQRLDALRQGMQQYALARCRQHQQRVDECAATLRRLAEGGVSRRRAALAQRRLALAAQSPAARAGRDRRRLAAATDRLHHRMEQYTSRLRHELGRDAARLRALGPLAVLERGYSITRRPDGEVIRSAAELAPGARIETVLHRGTLTSIIDQVHRRNHDETE
jgi:exodeoxyribonuclease VII large subunit